MPEIVHVCMYVCTYVFMYVCSFIVNFEHQRLILCVYVYVCVHLCVTAVFSFMVKYLR